MNANELAVWLNLYRKNDEQYNDRHLREASEMLHQQQLEIKELTIELDTQKNLNRKLYGVVGWLQENRPDVWEEMKQWLQNEKTQEK